VKNPRNSDFFNAICRPCGNAHSSSRCVSKVL
jgi:hypothetical protein